MWTIVAAYHSFSHSRSSGLVTSKLKNPAYLARTEAWQAAKRLIHDGPYVIETEKSDSTFTMKVRPRDDWYYYERMPEPGYVGSVEWLRDVAVERLAHHVGRALASLFEGVSVSVYGRGYGSATARVRNFGCCTAMSVQLKD
jgi:hypothetical protein